MHAIASMNVLKRNNVVIKGHGSQVLMFAHGFGCDQNMWRLVAPAFEENYKIILFDHVGAGKSDLSAFIPQKYEKLDGYADDILEIAATLDLQNIIFVGHSVSALMGMIASKKAPGLFKSLILVSPSPSYINDTDYQGGFTRSQIEELLESLDQNHLGWSMSMAAIAKHFARTTFLTDKRDILSSVDVKSLILQCSDDVIAPQSVGEYMHQHMNDSKLVVMKATGHCPNLSAPEETIDEIMKFLS